MQPIFLDELSKSLRAVGHHSIYFRAKHIQSLLKFFILIDYPDHYYHSSASQMSKELFGVAKHGCQDNKNKSCEEPSVGEVTTEHFYFMSSHQWDHESVTREWIQKEEAQVVEDVDKESLSG